MGDIVGIPLDIILAAALSFVVGLGVVKIASLRRRRRQTLPPPDHEDFLKARSEGFEGLRAGLDQRRRPPQVVAVLQGKYTEAYQVVVTGPDSCSVVESTDDIAQAKDCRKVYLEAGYRAGIVADGVFRA